MFFLSIQVKERWNDQYQNLSSIHDEWRHTYLIKTPWDELNDSTVEVNVVK